MRRLASFLKWAAFAFVVLPLADKCLLGQQGPPPIVKEVATRNDDKLDSSLTWLSEYRIPAIYIIWWAEIAACEGLPLPIEKMLKVQYFQVNGPDFIPLDVGDIVLAVTYWNDQTYIAYPYIWNASLVKHEALHLLLKWAGDPRWYDHDPLRFSSCGIKASGEPPPNK